MHHRVLLALFTGISWLPLSAQEVVWLSPYEVPGGQLPPSPAEKAYAETLFRPLQDTPPYRLQIDQLLAQQPGFSLFRRTGSLSSHPSIQGATLRNIGTNASGRTLVLYDGIPQNDPYGGWIYWNRLPLAGIELIDLQAGGGSGPWGNDALAGVIRLYSPSITQDRAFADISYGSHDTRQGLIRGSKQLSENNSIALCVHHFDTAGFFSLADEDRGAIDTKESARFNSVNARWQHRWNDEITSQLAFGFFQEDRGNGTVENNNQSRHYDVSLSLIHETTQSAAGWEAHLYWQDRRFVNQFTSVADDRNSERPVLDQFDIPSTGAGANFILRQPFGDHLLETGFDVRYVDGETNERFRNLGAGFTRQREAGGEQILAGFFVEDTWQATEQLTVNLGGRLDYARQQNGRRQEINLENDTVLRDDSFAEEGEWVPNLRLGGVYQFDEQWSARLATYTGFRLPTLNELYRPFRVGNDITEANPNLAEERLWGVEGALRHDFSAAFSLEATVFYNQLHDGVANITLTEESGFSPLCGFVPPGGSCRQRLNLERVDVTGVESRIYWQISETVSLDARHLYARSTVKSSPLRLQLEGLRTPQTPLHQYSVEGRWKALERLNLSSFVRGSSNQFEDDLNARSLAGFAVVDLAAQYTLQEDMVLYTSVENLANNRIEAGVSGDGLVTLGAPRMWRVGMRYTY